LVALRRPTAEPAGRPAEVAPAGVSSGACGSRGTATGTRVGGTPDRPTGPPRSAGTAARSFGTEQPHPAAVAYQKGKSTANHVWAHAGAEVVITADVRDFFPNTRTDRVEAWWRERVDGDTARLLTVLTTDRGGLPQGAPTSPALSNLVNFELDARLARRAAAAGARYTRYCDDLAFSWPVGSAPLADFERGVRAVLHEFGYSLHPEKGWRVYQRGDEPEVTGAILTRSGGVRLPDRLRRAMRTLARSADPRDAQRLEGYQGYAAMVTEPPIL
jgi:RNA-directed DNA polymerase